MQGQVIQLLSGYYDIAVGDQVIRTRAAGNLRQKKVSPIAGDFVEFTPAPDNGELGYLTRVLPRRNALVRPPVANVDQAMVITAAAEPTFATNLLDRFLVYLAGQRIAGVITVTKTDLLDDTAFARLQAVMNGYERIGYQVHLPRQPFGAADLEALRSVLNGRLTIFTGQTGAGKSTLLNHLVPDLSLATAAISKSLNRGKHTTRKTTLYRAYGGLVADTPGFSSLELLDVETDALRDRFPEFVAVAGDCKFRGCQHLQEPHCAVKAAVAAGQIMQSRYDNYCQFHAELAARKPVYDKKKR
ncbi:ribosome small subunit-dependent GTPase A [Lacticaseibacillus thailandensis]|uniref:Small ribosomal subunit biogenesis GTPase RsgA n=1 Tax=Lacticaseibacillus thailandensis DSM 22698 = JCM 13996 TaxID=1423810 RepID=A0A0R2CA42_9LACO|nr:ribosome small subunit-dependent GTPase A [Lacticaseibacillus thailandensis]KRM88245.1 GTPase engC [Lacticaseibacillus thailandensis DSM 22698 = JCM 13996]